MLRNVSILLFDADSHKYVEEIDNTCTGLYGS